jgi:predicted PurR-regulated permease PerM
MPGWVLILLALAVAAVVASRITHPLMMLTAAAVIAYMLGPVICFIERLGIKRSVAVILFFLLAALCVIAVHRIFIPDFRQASVNVYTTFLEFSRQIQDALLSAAQSVVERYPFLESAIMNFVYSLFGQGGFLEKTLTASEILLRATSVAMTLILVPFFVFFLLKDWPGVMKRVMDWVPASYVETTISVMGEINILVGQYLRGLAADCLAIGMLASAGLWVIGIKSPVMLGVLTGVANIVPYLGPIIGCTVSSLLALLQYRSADPLVNVVILYLSIKLMDDLVLQPLFIGKSVHLHPMLLVVTLIVGKQLFGIQGMILGVPVVTTAQKIAGVLLEHRRETQRRESRVSPIRHSAAESPLRPV